MVFRNILRETVSSMAVPARFRIYWRVGRIENGRVAGDVEHACLRLVPDLDEVGFFLAEQLRNPAVRIVGVPEHDGLAEAVACAGGFLTLYASVRAPVALVDHAKGRNRLVLQFGNGLVVGLGVVLDGDIRVQVPGAERALVDTNATADAQVAFDLDSPIVRPVGGARHRTFLHARSRFAVIAKERQEMALCVRILPHVGELDAGAKAPDGSPILHLASDLA